jgi:hypothetical protein
VRRAGTRCYLELDLDDPRLEDERERLEAEPERAFVERLDDERALVERLDEPEPDLARLDEPERDELARDEPDPDFARLDEPDPDFARVDDPERERLDAEPERELFAREPELRDPLDERLEPFDELRELLDDERRELDRDLPLRRSAAGISSLATAFASCGICFSRNFAMRSSSRRMPRASLAVSLSFTASASASMPV